MTGTRRSPATSERVAASFRDPSGYVFRRGKRVYRAIDEPCHEVLNELAARGTLQTLMDEGWLVRTQWVKTPAKRARLAVENPGYEHFLQHRAIEPVTYPYEWSASMLADAAVLTLRLQLRLLEAGCALKDASAYNVQFSGGRPVFIDFGSIERPARNDLWYALGQFHRMFTFPLLLCRLKGWDLRSYFLGAPNGRTVDEVVRALGLFGRWRLAYLLDVTLPWLLSSRCPSAVSAVPFTTGSAISADDRAQRLNLRRLERKLRRLADGYCSSDYWIRYATEHGYDRMAEAAKKDRVQAFLKAHRPRRVIDLGCNTGQYSRLAADCGAQVVAVDQSHDAIERFYRQLREKPAPITPMVMDLTSPSPGLGFRNRERPGFFRRVRGDCVFALALVHHLLVDGNLSLCAIRDQLADLTRRDLVVEYVPPDDPMFRRLVAARRQRFEQLTPERFRGVFQRRFELLGEELLPSSTRSLLFLRKRG